MSGSSLKLTLHCPVFTGFDGGSVSRPDALDRISLRHAFVEQLDRHVEAGRLTVEMNGVQMGIEGRALEMLTVSSGTVDDSATLEHYMQEAFTRTVQGDRRLLLRRGAQTLCLRNQARLEFSYPLSMGN